MSKWKCEICGKEFENFHAQGFEHKIYCPLCYFKKLTNDLQQENQQLKEQNEDLFNENHELRKKLEHHIPEEQYADMLKRKNNQLKQRDEVIDKAIKEIKNIQKHYHKLIMKDYKQEESIFVNKCCKNGFILNVRSYFDLIELILNKYKGDNNE